MASCSAAKNGIFDKLKRFAQKTKPDGEAVGSCGAMRQAGHTSDGGQPPCPAGSGGSGGGGGTIAARGSAACCGACQCSSRRKPKTCGQR